MVIFFPYLYFYSEYSNLLFFGIFGVYKLKLPTIINIMHVNNYLFLEQNFWFFRMFFFRCLFHFRFICIFVSNFILRLLYMLRRVYRMSGIGFKFSFLNGFYFFKLGYSHLIYNFLDLGSFFLKKKNRFIVRFSLFDPTSDAFLFLSYRPLNLYSGKGIVDDRFVFIRKLFKK